MAELSFFFFFFILTCFSRLSAFSRLPTENVLRSKAESGLLAANTILHVTKKIFFMPSPFEFFDKISRAKQLNSSLNIC